MTDDEIRVTIATECGWTDIHGGPPDGSFWRGSFNGGRVRELPDYPNDLNAMREAEESLGDGFIDRYCIILCGMVNYNVTQHSWNIIRAGARQRAEAFLRAIRKWKEAA